MLNIRQKTLANGLRLIVAEDHTLPIACCTIWYRVGARYEPLGQTGISHLLEHLMFKGTRKYPKGTIDEMSLRLGGNNNAFTSYDYTGYYFAFASDRWTVALDIEADRMRSLLFRRDEFEMEKQVVLEELKMGEDNPWELLRRNVNALAYHRHPYRNPIIGWQEDLERLTMADVKRFYRKYYQPANAILVITGDVDSAEAAELAAERFAGLQSTPVARLDLADEGFPEGVIRFQSVKPSHVPRLLMAFHGPSARQREIYTINVLRYILSEGRTSRLHRRLVEKEQTASSFSIYFEDMRDPGLFTLGVELKEGQDFTQVEASIVDELEKVRADGVSESELVRAKRQLEADFIFEQEDIVTMAVNLGFYECVDSYKFYLEFLENILRTDLGDVQDAARKYLDPQRCVIGRLEGGKGGRPDTSEETNLPVAVQYLNQSGPVDGRPTWRRCFEKVKERDGEIENFSAATDVSPRALKKRDSNLVACSRIANRKKTGKGPGVHLSISAHQLANGLTVLFCPLPRIPAVTLNAIILSGSREDPPGAEGLANVLGNMLDEGTTLHSHEEIATFVDQCGGTLDVFGSREACGISMKLLKEDLDTGLDFLREMLFESVFPVERLELTRSQILTHIATLEDRPDYIGSREFNRLIYQGTPLANPSVGFCESVTRINRKQLDQFHLHHFTPANTVLALVGDFDPERELTTVAKTWGARPGGKRPVRQTFSLTRQRKPLQSRIAMADKEQLHIYLGHLGIRRAHPDYYRLLLMDVILGGGPGFTARIPRRLRDEKGLAYNTYAEITGSAGLDEGRFEAYVGTSPESRDEAIAGILEEVRRIRRDPITATELADAKNFLIGSFVFKFETMSQIATFMLAAYIHGLGFDYPDRFPDMIQGITAAEIRDAARRHLDPDSYTLVEVGPVDPGSKAVFTTKR